MANPFDQFDQANPFDQFDVKPEQGVTLSQVPGLALRSAVQGTMALPSMIADPITNLVNYATGLQFTPPSQALKQGLTQIGLPEYPKTELGRVAEAGAEAVTGTGAQLQLARQLAEKAISPVTRLVSQEAAKQPAAQLGVSAPAAIASQATLEATGSPLAALAVGGGTGALGGVRTRKFEDVPTSELLAQQAKQEYKRAAEAGVVIKPESVQSLSQRMYSAAKEASYDPDLHPGVAIVLRRLEREGDTPKTLEDMEILRRVVRAPSGDFTNPDQQRIAGILTKKFDEAINQIGPNDILAGDSKQALDALSSARQLYARNKKSDIIEDLVKKADLSSTQYSQSGLENALRVQFRALAKNKTKMAQFSKEEQDQIRLIVKGGPVQNALRFVGKFAPTGVVSSLPTGAAAAVSPYLAPVVPLVSFPARKAAEQMGMANIDMLTNMIRLGRRPEVISGGLQAVPQTTMRGLISSQQE